MRKGDITFVAIGGIAAAVMFVVFISFVMGGVIETNVEEQRTTDQLNTESMLYLVDICFRQGTDYVQAGFLDESRRKGVCDVCKSACASGNRVLAKVQDLEDPSRSWDMDYDEKKVKSDGYIRIMYEDGKVHAGRLYVAFA